MEKFNKLVAFILEDSTDSNSSEFDQILDNMLLSRTQEPKNDKPILGDKVYLELTGKLDVKSTDRIQLAGVYNVIKASTTAITLEPTFEQFEPNKENIIDGSATSKDGYKQDLIGLKGIKPTIDPSKEPTGKAAEAKAEKESDIGKYAKVDSKPITITFKQMTKCMWMGNKSPCNPQWMITVMDFEPVEVELEEPEQDQDFKEVKPSKIEDANKKKEIKI